jgi:trimeric autotransporter adhesin
MSFQVPLAGQSINTATIGIETNISSSSASIGNASITNLTVGQLSTTIFNPASVTTATLDVTSGIIDTLVVNNVMDFLNVTEINACRKNVCNISTLNLSASQITCDNLQPLLTAGTNISILDGVISAVNEALLPADATFDSVTSDIVNALYIDANNVSIDNLSIDQKLSVSGNVNISGLLFASNLSTGAIKFGSGLLYDQFDSELEVEVNQFIQEGSNLPVTSWAVYKAIDNQFSNIQAQTCYRLYETDFHLDNSQVGATQDVIIFYTDYFPQYEESKIIVEFCYSYSVAGSGTDGITTYIQIGRNNNANQEIIQMLFQDWTNAGGGGTRSGASSSIMGMYVNEDNIGKYHRIKMRVDNNSDDTWQLDSTSYPVVKITEFIPIAGISNPNIRLGNGNISCGNISCNSLTITDLTIDNVITNYNVNVGGDMITVGFPISGSIVSKSYVRLAGANTVLNYGDLTWDGTTFNLSTRQADKNFKVSFAQQDYFEVNSNNTSCRSLYVNGNISMSGTLTIAGALLFTNAIIENSLLVNGLITASSAEFSDDVTFDDNVSMHKRLNVSNVSVTQGLTVYGNISTRGNISANSIFAPNLSTASLKPGTNITIVDGFINAYVEGGTLVDCGSLQVDTDANIFGILNVSKTSTFSESLNVCNIIYAGKTGQHDGSVVVYSQSIGNNWATKYDGTVLNMSATGTTSQVNTWLGSDKILSITPTGVNICGTLKADYIDADYTNFSSVNLSVQNATVGLLTVENTSGINASFNQLSGSIIDVTQLNGTNGHFTSSLTAANISGGNISTGSMVFGSGLNFFLGALSVDFTTSETQVANLQNSIAQEVETNSLNAGLAVIDVLSITTFINTPEINASVMNCSDIEINTGTIDVLDCTNISTDVLDVNTSITTRHLNCSTLTLTDTAGAGGLNVCGVAYFDSLFCYGTAQFETDNVFFGKPEATGTNARINFWSQITPVAVGLQFGIDTDDIVRMNIPTSGGSTAYNILMGNVSTMTMTNTSTRFHQEVIMTNLSVENISSPALTTANMSIGNGLNFSNNILTGTSSLTAGNNLQIISDIISTSTNINVSNLSSVNLVVNTSISTRHVNCSTLTLTDSTGAGGLKVTGTAYIDAIITYYPCEFQTNTIYVGKRNGTGTESTVNFFALSTANELQGKIGIDTDNALRLSVLDYGQISAKINIQIKNVSYLTMENNSTRFQKPVIFQNDVTGSKITFTNICNTNLSTTNCTITTLRGTTLNGATINASNLNISTKLTTTNISATNLSTTNCTITTLRGTTLNGTTINASNLNISTKLTTTNISATNITATSITAPDVQPTLTAGTNIAIVGNVISSTGGGTTLTAGNNIQIVGDVISTTASLNSSNISSINGSFTNLTCSGSVTSATLNSSTLNSSNIIVNTKVTTTNLSVTTATINTSLSANYIYTNTMTVGGLLTTGFFESEDFFTGDLTSSGIIFGNEIRATIVKSATVNGTSINCSSINCSLTINTCTINCSDIDSNLGTIDQFDSTFATLTNLSSTNISATQATISNSAIIAKTLIHNPFQNAMCIAHSNFTGQGDYALNQYAGGSTSLNSPTGVATVFRNGGTEVATLGIDGYRSGKLINCSNISNNNFSGVNISASVITATSIVAPDVQPTLTAGTGITLVGNVISSTGGGTTYTEGNNIQIVGDVISTTASLNSSNISSINGSFTNLTCSGSVTSATLNSSTLNSSNIIVNTKVTTTNLSVTTATINTSLSANYIYTNTMTVGGLLTTGFFESEDFFTGDLTSSGIIFGNEIRATIVKSATVNGTTMNCSNINISTNLTTTNISATNITATSIVAPDVQPTLTTSNNIQIIADTISTTDVITSTTHNVSTINASNISASQMSLTGDLTMGGYVNRKNSFIRLYRNGNETLDSTSYQVIYGADQYVNTDLVTVTDANLFTIVKAGRYKVSSTVSFSNGTYTDRMNWRVRLYKNDSHNNSLGQVLCYTRHRDYAEYGSAYHSTIQDFAVGDTFYYQVTCNKASATGFTSDMTGSQVLNNTCIEIEYLGE